MKLLDNRQYSWGGGREGETEAKRQTETGIELDLFLFLVSMLSM